MRELTQEEAEVVVKKLSKYIGQNVSVLFGIGKNGADADGDDSDDPDGTGTQDDFSNRLYMHENRVFVANKKLSQFADMLGRQRLAYIGTCIGKFSTHGNLNFKLVITALPVIAPLAKYKAWLKPKTGEMSFLYGKHILKAHIDRMTDAVPEHEGIIIFDGNSNAVGFGTTARAATQLESLDPTAIAIFHQADVGEYLRDENKLS